MADTNPSLKGAWSAEFTAWHERLAPVFQRLREVPVLILSWGPGPHMTEHAKRKQLNDDLNAHNANNHALTSEELFDREPDFRLFGDTLDAEQIQAANADVIIVLVLKDGPGVRAELLDIRRHPQIVANVRLLLPKGASVPGRGIADIGIRSVPPSQTYQYTPKQFTDCHDMRAKCRQWVDEVRGAKFLTGAMTTSIAPGGARGGTAR
jgi:hypothetical protein